MMTVLPLTPEEIDEATKKSVDYRPPGLKRPARTGVVARNTVYLELAGPVPRRYAERPTRQR